MGFRDLWVKHDDLLSCHSEVFIHCLERVLAGGVKDVLHVEFGNGGTLQVLEQLMPEDGSVLGLSSKPFNEVPSVVADCSDNRAVFEALGSRSFDLIIDSSGVFSAVLWPYLRPAGWFVFEDYDPDMIMELLAAIAYQGESWLPVEEIMRVALYPCVLAVEKRHPRVVPYLDLVVGERDPVVPLREFIDAGAKKLILE